MTFAGQYVERAIRDRVVSTPPGGVTTVVAGGIAAGEVVEDGEGRNAAVIASRLRQHLLADVHVLRMLLLVEEVRQDRHCKPRRVDESIKSNPILFSNCVLQYKKSMTHSMLVHTCIASVPCTYWEVLLPNHSVYWKAARSVFCPR